MNKKFDTFPGKKSMVLHNFTFRVYTSHPKISLSLAKSFYKSLHFLKKKAQNVSEPNE